MLGNLISNILLYIWVLDRWYKSIMLIISDLKEGF